MGERGETGVGVSVMEARWRAGLLQVCCRLLVETLSLCQKHLQVLLHVLKSKEELSSFVGRKQTKVSPRVETVAQPPTARTRARLPTYS